MFVVDESLPKVDFFTRIDKIIATAVTLVASSGFASVMVAATLDPPWSTEGEATLMTERLNFGSAILLIAGFVVANMYYLLPAFLKRRKRKDLIQGIQSIHHDEPKRIADLYKEFGGNIVEQDNANANNDGPYSKTCFCPCNKIEVDQDSTSALRQTMTERRNNIDYWALPQTTSDMLNETFSGFKCNRLIGEGDGAPLQAEWLEHKPEPHNNVPEPELLSGCE